MHDRDKKNRNFIASTRLFTPSLLYASSRIYSLPNYRLREKIREFVSGWDSRTVAISLFFAIMKREQKKKSKSFSIVSIQFPTRSDFFTIFFVILIVSVVTLNVNVTVAIAIAAVMATSTIARATAAVTIIIVVFITTAATAAIIIAVFVAVAIAEEKAAVAFAVAVAIVQSWRQ